MEQRVFILLTVRDGDVLTHFARVVALGGQRERFVNERFVNERLGDTGTTGTARTGAEAV